jgi:hypothetical protein
MEIEEDEPPYKPRGEHVPLWGAVMICLGLTAIIFVALYVVMGVIAITIEVTGLVPWASHWMVHDGEWWFARAFFTGEGCAVLLGSIFWWKQDH